MGVIGVSYIVIVMFFYKAILISHSIISHYRKLRHQ